MRRFPIAEEGGASDEITVGFLRDLVKIDRGEEYASELWQWIAELEQHPDVISGVEPITENADTEKLMPPTPETQIMSLGEKPGSNTGGFDVPE